MRFRRKRYHRRRSLKKGAGVFHILIKIRVFLGKKTKKIGAGVVSKTLGHILETVGDVIGL